MVHPAAKLSRIDVQFQKGRKTVWFYYCEDLREAKERFQWAYGYWPDDEHILMTVNSDGPK